MEIVTSSLPIYIHFKPINRYKESTDHSLNSNNSISEYNLAMIYPFPPNQYNFKYILKERLLQVMAFHYVTLPWVESIFSLPDNSLCVWRGVSFSSIPYIGPADWKIDL